MTQEKESIWLKCKDCDRDFEFTGGEQLFFEKNALNPPKRCGMCRMKKRIRFEGQEDQSQTA